MEFTDARLTGFGGWAIMAGAVRKFGLLEALSRAVLLKRRARSWDELHYAVMRPARGKNPQPKFNGNYKATLYTPYDVRVSLALRYLGSTDNLGSDDIDFDAETYWDLTGYALATMREANRMVTH